MKKFIVMAVILVLIAGAGYAADVSNDASGEEDRRGSLRRFRRQLGQMKRDMDYLMKDVVTAYPWGEGTRVEGFGSEIRVDIIDREKSIIVKADIPGMDKDEINIKLENNKILTIAGTRDVITEETEPGLVRQERLCGEFERVLELPAECESKGIKAMYDKGVLEVVIPKAKEAKKEVVQINVQ